MEARSVITIVLEGFKDLTRGLSEVSTDKDRVSESFGLAMAQILDETLQYLTVAYQSSNLNSKVLNFRMLKQREETHEGERGSGWNRIDPIGFFESGYGAAVNADEMTAAEVSEDIGVGE